MINYRTNRRRLATLLALASIAGVASAQSDTPWNGVYTGVNAGGTGNSSCTRSTLNRAAVDSTGGANFSSCPSGGTVGGVQIGANFQTKRLVWGVGADFDVWSTKNSQQSLKYGAEVLPPGTYAYSGKLGPSDFIVVGPRIGYAGDVWLPYLRVGSIVTLGSRDNTLSYTAAGATKPTASFSGGKNLASTGWVAGAGAEIGLNGAWSITVDYLRANFGRGSNSISTCSGSASACAAFSGISLDSSHSAVTANIFRIGVNYWFGYWEL
jgi:opacity protein-like surface antigen